jgi:rhodanese-related sulfurtransferase
MRAALELVMVLTCASLGALATWKIAGPPSREIPCDPAALAPEEICLATLQAEWPAGSFLWIDARPAEEWRRDGVEGSISLTLTGGPPFQEQIEASLEKLATSSRAVVYCGSVGCGLSKEMVRRLNELGLIPEVRALHGGWEALHQAGLVKGSNPAN